MFVKIHDEGPLVPHSGQSVLTRGVTVREAGARHVLTTQQRTRAHNETTRVVPTIRTAPRGWGRRKKEFDTGWDICFSGGGPPKGVTKKIGPTENCFFQVTCTTHTHGVPST